MLEDDILIRLMLICIRKIKFNLENGLPLVSHFARLVGLKCEDEVTRSYGEEGKTLALTLDPSRIPGAQPFPEDALQPVVTYKADLPGRNKVKGNPTMDARWNKCAKNARTKWRNRNNSAESHMRPSFLPRPWRLSSQ